MGGLLGVFQKGVDLPQGLAADDAGDFQRKLGQHLTVLHDHDAASVPGDAVDGKGHVLVICADADDVVAVMGDGGGHRAGFQTVALEVADADVAGIFMPLYNGHFQNVLGYVHPSGVACVLGDDLPRHHADDAPQTGVGKVRGRKHRQVEGVVGALVQVFRDLGQGEVLHNAVVVDPLAPLVHRHHVEVLQILHNGEVRKISGGDGAPVIQQEVPGGVETGYLYGHDGVGTHGDSFPADVIDVTLFQQIAGVLVVGAEHAAAEIFLGLDQGHQSLQIPGGGALPDHDELTQFQFFHGVVNVRALVVGVDTGGNVGVQVGAGKTGGVAVDLLVVRLRRNDLGNGGGVGGDHAGEIHHFRKTQHPGVVEKAVDIPVVQIRAAFVQRRRRDAGGDHKLGVHRQPFRGAEHIVDAVGAHDVGDLMGVGDNGGGAVGDDCPGKLRGGNQTGFQMDVGVDEAGADDLAGHVHFVPAFVAAEAHDQTLRHGNVAGVQLPGKHVDIGGVFQNQIGFLPPGGDINDVQLF